MEKSIHITREAIEIRTLQTKDGRRVHIAHRPFLLVVKQDGAITDEEMMELRSRYVWGKTTDSCSHVSRATDSFGRGLAYFTDVYVIEQIGVLKRLCHTLRMIKAAITLNIGIGTLLRVVIIK